MNLRRDWNDFWFRPTPPGPIGVFRIVYSAVVLLYLALIFPDINLWFSNRGVLSQADSDAYNAYHIQGPILNLLHGIDNPVLLYGFFTVFLAAAICLLLGWWTRVAAVIVFLALNSTLNRNHPMTSGADGVMMVLAAYLVLMPAGAACSLDRLRRFMRGVEDEVAPPVLPWAQRLAQIQISVLYLISVLNKWPGETWRNGTAVYWALSIPDLHRFPVPWLNGDHLWLVNIFTYGTLATELALAFLVWVPRLRLYVLAAGVLMHIGIEYSMNIPLFSFLMIAGYVPFLTQTDLERFVAWVRVPLVSTRMRLVYDGHCNFCRSSLLVVQYLDVFRLINFLDVHDPDQLRLAPSVRAEQVEDAAIAVDRRGRQYAGFDAFRAMAWRLPATWLIAPFLYLPGVPWLGRRVYRWIATNRSRMPVAARFAKAAARKPTRLPVP
jgi:predicted DCC family thiol-disulfide oxidoreductase YuxK